MPRRTNLATSDRPCSILRGACSRIGRHRKSNCYSEFDMLAFLAGRFERRAIPIRIGTSSHPATLLLTCAALFSAALATCQTAPAPKNWTAAEDHRNMMEQLGIVALRPGPSGNEAAPNHANYDESAANPFPDYPEILRLKDGRPVTTPELWWKERRPEIVEDFEREVLGRVPPNAPKITWTVTNT